MGKSSLKKVASMKISAPVKKTVGDNTKKTKYTTEEIKRGITITKMGERVIQTSL